MEEALSVVPKDFSKISVKKLPEITALFWVLKIAATTLGETGGDEREEHGNESSHGGDGVQRASNGKNRANTTLRNEH